MLKAAVLGAGYMGSATSFTASASLSEYIGVTVSGKGFFSFG